MITGAPLLRMSVFDWYTRELSVKMAASLRRLVNIGTFNVLQEKLERWSDNYFVSIVFCYVDLMIFSFIELLQAKYEVK